MFLVFESDGRFVDYADGRFFLVRSWESAQPYPSVASALAIATYLTFPNLTLYLVSDSSLYRIATAQALKDRS